MGTELLQQMLPALARVKWSENENISDVGRLAYDNGLEKVENARGNPRELINALRVFTTCASAPYAFAGVAYTLIAAAHEADGSYAPAGLEAAMRWLERAQALAPEAMEINFIEPLVYVHTGRLEDARTVLDYLLDAAGRFYYLRLVDVAYYEKIDAVAETKLAYDAAMAAAENVPQRLRLQERLADSLSRFGLVEEAIETYRKAIPFDSQNAMLWHKISVLYFNLGQIEEAERYNTQTLKLKAIPAAVNLQEAINEQKGGALSRLFRR